MSNETKRKLETTMNRIEIADDLLTGCPVESLRDHEDIAEAILRGDSREEILRMRETNRWPDTYAWLSVVMLEVK